MTTIGLNRAAAYDYTSGYDFDVTSPTPIPFGDTEGFDDLEQCVMEFDIDPATIDTGSAVTLTFKLVSAAAGTKYLRRWTEAYPPDGNFSALQSATALSTTTNQQAFTDTGTATVSLDIRDLVDDMVSNSQPKVIVGIRETGNDGISGFINNDDTPPTLTYNLSGSTVEGTATLLVEDIVLIAEGRADTRAATSVITIDDITLISTGYPMGSKDALLVLDDILLAATAETWVRGGLSTQESTEVFVSLVSEGKVYVQGTASDLDVWVDLISNNRATEGTAILYLDDILVSGEIPQGGEPRRGTVTRVITIDLLSVMAPARIGTLNLTGKPITITLYARSAGDPPVDADSPFLDSNIPLFVGSKTNATFSGSP